MPSESCRSRLAERSCLSLTACTALGRRRVLKVGTGLVLDGVLRVLGAADAAKAADVDDAHCSAPGGGLSRYSTARFAQTFTVEHTGLLTKATVQAAGGSAGAINEFLIEIRTTSRKGKPTATVLASYKTPAFDRPSSGQTTPQVATFGPLRWSRKTSAAPW